MTGQEISNYHKFLEAAPSVSETWETPQLKIN